MVRLSAMSDFLEQNRLNWDARVRIHEKSSFYDVEGFRAGRSTLEGSIELVELGDVSGFTLLHLQCHFGMDTISWARLGAIVTGVDFSERAVELARSLAREVGVEARFLSSDIYKLPAILEAKFDIVFTSWGVLPWLPDLPGWAAIVGHFIRPGGRFYIIDGHPVINALDQEGDLFRSSAGYFQGSEPLRFDDGRTYADADAVVEAPTNYQWNHSLGEVVTALADTGLRIEFLHEHGVLPWRRFESMVRGSDGRWRLRGDPFPLSFSILAWRPT